MAMRLFLNGKGLWEGVGKGANAMMAQMMQF